MKEHYDQREGTMHTPLAEVAKRLRSEAIVKHNNREADLAKEKNRILNEQFLKVKEEIIEVIKNSCTVERVDSAQVYEIPLSERNGLNRPHTSTFLPAFDDLTGVAKLVWEWLKKERFEVSADYSGSGNESTRFWIVAKW